MSGVDVTAVARVVGIESTFFPDIGRTGILNLPMRIAVCAQGSSDAVYSADKWTALSAAAAGARYGYGSPIHRALLRLKPPNGDGVGSIPVEILPLSDAVGAAAAAGELEVSGTQTATASYKVVIGGTKSRSFTIAKNATSHAKYRAIMDAITAVLEMPVNAEYAYGTVTAAALSGTGNGTITSLSAPGQPIPGVYRLQVNTVVANGGVWTLTDPDGEVLADDITMTPGAGQATVITTNGLQFTLTDNTTDFGLNAYFDITVPVDHIDLTAKWKGPTGNDIVITVEDGDGGTTFTMVQPTGGAGNPTVTTALNKIGNMWTTLVLNGLNIADTDVLDEYSTFGEGRRGVTVHKPLLVFTGNTLSDATEATAVADSRKTDRTNVQLPSPGSDDLPIDVAARQLARIAVVANNSPASDYGGRQATGLTPGPEDEQWNWEVRDYVVKRGGSTVEAIDGVVQLSDICTMYHPTGEDPPGYRYVVDCIKEMNIIFNFAVKFASAEWNGKPLVPDTQVVTNKDARKPKAAKVAASNIIDALGLAAMISAPDVAKETLDCGIDEQNPKRINVEFELQFSGNANIISIPFRWGFYYGVPAAA